MHACKFVTLVKNGICMQNCMQICMQICMQLFCMQIYMQIWMQNYNLHACKIANLLANLRAHYLSANVHAELQRNNLQISMQICNLQIATYKSASYRSACNFAWKFSTFVHANLLALLHANLQLLCRMQICIQNLHAKIHTNCKFCMQIFLQICMQNCMQIVILHAKLYACMKLAWTTISSMFSEMALGIVSVIV